MTSDRRLRIALVRRGYSPSGGAEAYLKRLGQGIVERGHEAQLISTNEWPANDWPFGPITRTVLDLISWLMRSLSVLSLLYP